MKAPIPKSRSEAGRRLTALGAVVITAAALLGCGRQHAGHHAQDPDREGEPHAAAETGVTFNAKQGLRISEATAAFLGLQVADVEERVVTASLEFPAQVYRAGNDANPVTGRDGDGPAAWASGSVSVRDAARLSEGQAASVRGDTREVLLAGRIAALKRDAERVNGLVEVLVAIQGGGESLAVGSFLSVTVVPGGGEPVASVPREALFRTTEGDFVYTVSGGHYVRTPVTLGMLNRELAEVSDGLYGGDRVVVRPVMALWLAELQSLRGGKACADGH